MKTSCLGLLLCVVALSPSASANFVTVDTDTADTFAFDIVWGQTWPGNQWTFFNSTYQNAFNQADDVGWLVDFVLVTSPGTPQQAVTSRLNFVLTPGPSWGDVGFVTNRTFVLPTVDGLAPTSISEIADGYGAHIVYGSDLVGSDSVSSVPELGQTAILLTVALCWLGWTARIRFHEACKVEPPSPEGG
jgi:hypothetical protein